MNKYEEEEREWDEDEKQRDDTMIKFMRRGTEWERPGDRDEELADKGDEE